MTNSELSGDWRLMEAGDVAETRSKGAFASIVAHVLRLAQADGLASCSLVAVNNSAPFWQRFGFIETGSDDMQQKLQSYGSDARFMTHRF